MRKNIIKLLAILAMCFMVVAVLASCGQKEAPAVEENNNNQNQNTKPETWVNDKTGTVWVGDYDTGVPAGDENREYCVDHEWHHECIVREHTQDGTTEIIFYGCLDCNYCYTEEIGHVFEKVETVAATCTTYGYDLYECRCGATEERAIVDKLGHDFPVWNAKWTHETVDTTVWTALTTIASTDCPCEFVGEYDAKCTRCDVRTDAKETVKVEHSYTKFYPAVPDATLSPCLQASYEIAKCDNCNHAENVVEHAGCVNHAFYKQTASQPGHIFTKWTVVGNNPTETTGAKIVRSCTRSGCNTKADASEFNSTLPALSEANGWTLTVKEPSCVETGLKTYTMTKDNTTFTYTVVIDTEGGHKINDAKPVIVAPTTTQVGSVKVVCPDCDAELTYDLAVIPTAAAYRNGATAGYTIVRGTCADPTVTFKLVITDNDFFTGHSIKVEFSIKDQAYHPHAVSANIADCIIAKDEHGVESYFALCQNSDGCHQWIYVGPVNKNN